MSRLFALFATTAMSVLISVSAFGGNELYYSAMDLAIENFNADGTKELKAWGPEHTLMLKALEAVAKQYPELAAASKTTAFSSGKRFSSLMVVIEKREIHRAAGVAITKKVQSLVDGCGFTRDTRTEEQQLGYTQPSVTKVIATTYRLDGSGKKKCKSPAAKTLLGFGLNEVVVRESDGRRGDQFEFVIQSGGSAVQDMRYVKSQLLKNANVDAELIALLDPPAVGGTIGASSDIRLLNSNGKATLADAFTLEYFIGSGDCPAGCITKTYFTVDVRPISGIGTMDPKFEIVGL